MKSILEAFYCGNIRPEETIVPTDTEYRTINRKLSEAMKMWKEKLSSDDFYQLEAMLDLRGQSGSMYAKASFMHGFQLGALMLIEIYTAKDELLIG